jgi:hypothetical protein
MTTRSAVVTFTLAIGIVLSLAGCSSDDDDKEGPPATSAPTSTADDVAAPTDVPQAETAGPDTSGTDTSGTDTSGTDTRNTVPSTGIGSIDGPATVDSDFGGANPGGDDDGG